MASQTTPGTKGRAPKYILADVHTKTTKLSAKGKDGKDYAVDSVIYEVSDMAQILEVFGNSTDAVFAFVSDALTDYAQRGDRSKLSALAQGPTKSILRFARDYQKALASVKEISNEEAISEALKIMVDRNVIDQKFADDNKADLVNKLNNKDAKDEDENETESAA